MNATELAISALQKNRRVRQQNLLAKVEAEDARTDHAMKYVGSIRGQHYGQTAGGGLLPFEASSNGSIASQELMVGTIGRSSNQAIGQWMPR